ncbi:BZ3500_MvSof-1268-A1-R1_Chr3-1g05742 [Microbotryum saponariae]|uniref:BZ3500_MvSof-1268-A1-R1_Chr3-1g05742 protein n=1 Tax=Microbotryum saponariae TaxID=289078 RepID=A0A2X0N1C6_9BASI|nr:BZ3500_MvSof-1268-A1-R1_Chr3-1g05742 [Microbotryum saponariae]SDA04932.1 BZ3501_MvSof-1269-A2-R1_Chr3-1g05412 [Microbotryum saponariae]
MSAPTLEKHEDQHIDRIEGFIHPAESETQDTLITWRSWAYAAIGCLFYFSISWHLATTSIFRSSMGAALGNSAQSIWLINIVSTFQACVGPPLMYASDLFDRRWILVVVSFIAVVGSVVASRATSFGMGLVGQGIVSIGMSAVGAGYAIPAEVFPRQHRGKVQGATNFAASLGGGLGVITSARLVANSPLNGWRTCFYIAIGLFSMMFLLLLIVYRPPPRPTEERSLPFGQKLARLDWIGYVLVIASLCLFLVGCTQGGTDGWKAGKTLGPLVSGIALMVVFGVYEWKGTEVGLFHHAMFCHRNFPLALMAAFVEGTIFFSILAFLPVAAAGLWAPQDAFKANIYLAPFYLTSVPLFFVNGWYVDRFKEFRLPLVIGYLLYLGACIGLALSDRNDNAIGWAMSSLAGIGFAAPIALLFAVAQLAVPGKFIGSASALMVAARAVGGAVGVAVYSAVLGDKLSVAIPARITAGAFKGGLSPAQASTVLPELIPLIASQNPAIIAKAFMIPDIQPGIVLGAIEGVQSALAYGLSFVWYIAVAFSALGIITVLTFASSKDQMTSKVDAPAQRASAAVYSDSKSQQSSQVV